MTISSLRSQSRELTLFTTCTSEQASLTVIPSSYAPTPFSRHSSLGIQRTCKLQVLRDSIAKRHFCCCCYDGILSDFVFLPWTTNKRAGHSLHVNERATLRIIEHRFRREAQRPNNWTHAGNRVSVPGRP
jgi:hypothetical protein